MLNPVAELAKHGVGNIQRILRHEKYADAFGSDQPHDLLDAIEQSLWRIGEEQVRFVEEEYEFRFVRVTDFRQALVELGEQPEQQRCVEHRRLHQTVRREHVDDAAASVGLQQVVDVEHRLADEFFRTLLFQHEQTSLDGTG